MESDNKKYEQKQTIPATPAQQLATLDANSNSVLDINDSRVQEIQRHLTNLSNAFGQPESV